MRLPMMFSIALLATLVACGPNRPNYEQMANNALNNAGLSDIDTNYDNGANVVHLTGTVATDAERQRAGDLVRQAVSPGAQVANEVTVASNESPMNQQTAGNMDSQISDRLDDMVDRDQSLKNADVNFDVNNGVVTITGRVPTTQAKQRVGDMAKNVDGVKNVVNSLQVKRS
jgi:hyperosmotically inducible periplasmic protein